jgi:hypothetical protein
LSAALTAFSADRAVRIMSIHKSKGLEFDTVIMMGVEEETFWGTIEEERSAYFVGISRAKNKPSPYSARHTVGQPPILEPLLGELVVGAGIVVHPSNVTRRHVDDGTFLGSN